MGFVIDERCHIVCVSGLTENVKTLILWQSSKSYELSLLFYIDNFLNWEFSLNWAFLSSQSTNYFSKKQTMQLNLSKPTPFLQSSFIEKQRSVQINWEWDVKKINKNS